MSQPEQQLHQQIEWLLCAAKSRGITSAEVSVSRGQGVSVTVRQQQPEIIEHYEDQSVNIAVYCDGRKGMASTTDLREDSLARALDAAYQIAQYTVATQQRVYLKLRILLLTGLSWTCIIHGICMCRMLWRSVGAVSSTPWI